MCSPAFPPSPRRRPPPQPATEDARLAAFFEEVFPARPEGQPDLPVPARHEGPGLRQVERLLGRGGAAPGRARPAATSSACARSSTTRKLSEPMKVSYRIFEVQSSRRSDTSRGASTATLSRRSRTRSTTPVTFMQNVHSMDSVEDAEAYVSRLNGRGARLRTVHRRHERVRAARHRADLVLVRPGDRRQPQRDHRRAIRRQRQGFGDPRRLPRQGGEARVPDDARRSGCSTPAWPRCRARADRHHRT